VLTTLQKGAILALTFGVQDDFQQHPEDDFVRVDEQAW
jgi:hypothetical protein